MISDPRVSWSEPTIRRDGKPGSGRGLGTSRAPNELALLVEQNRRHHITHPLLLLSCEAAHDEPGHLVLMLLRSRTCSCICCVARGGGGVRPSRRNQARGQEGDRPSPPGGDSRADSIACADLIAEDCVTDGRRPAHAPGKAASLGRPAGPGLPRSHDLIAPAGAFGRGITREQPHGHHSLAGPRPHPDCPSLVIPVMQIHLQARDCGVTAPPYTARQITTMG